MLKENVHLSLTEWLTTHVTDKSYFEGGGRERKDSSQSSSQG